MICEKHGQSALGPRKGVIYCGHCNEPVRFSLQLLILDLGDSCVVKVEKGNLPELRIGQTQLTNSTGESNSILIDETITDLRAALDGDKPETRIERRTDGCYGVFDQDIPWIWLTEAQYTSLCKIADKGLMWTGSGEWEKIFDGFLQMACDVWRYTR